MFVVLNQQFQILSPYATGYLTPTGEGQRKQVTLPDADQAKAFAEYMAKTHRDQRFNVFELIGYAQAVEPPIKWYDAR